MPSAPANATRSGLLLAGLGGCLTALMIGAAVLHDPSPDRVGSESRINALVVLLGVGALIYFWAVWIALRRLVPRRTVWLVLIVAVAMRVPLLASAPFLSTDVFRYVWDGQVQRAGNNPYRYVPADPALASLRDPAVYPYVSRADYAPTIYPPMAQLVFAAVGRVTRSVTGMKLAMVGFEAIAVGCLLRLLVQAELPLHRLLIYAWNPLAASAIAGDGHVDAIAIGLLAVALICQVSQREVSAIVMLSGAALVKFLPLVVAPAFIRRGHLVQPALAAAATVALLYAAYASAGRRVVGFLAGYRAEEHLDNGLGFWPVSLLAHLAPLPPWAGTLYVALAGGGLAVLALVIMRRPPHAGPAGVVELCQDTAILSGAAMMALTPHYAWYYVWLAIPSVVAPMPAIIWLSAAPALFYVDPLPDRAAWTALVYVPAIVLLIVSFRRRVRTRPRATAISGAGQS